VPPIEKAHAFLRACIRGCAAVLLVTLLSSAVPAWAALGDETATLVPTDAAADDLFGWSTAISGNRAIVGAYDDDDPQAGIDAGSVYVFDVPSGNQLAKLTANDAAPEDLFGNSVALNGNIAIVGAMYDNGAHDTTGSAYVFEVTTGNQLAKMTASDAGAMEFGRSVAISGNTAIVGADSQAAYLFDVTNPNNPTQYARLTAADTAPYDHFAYSVAISGNVALVGAAEDDDAGSASGSAYLFDATTGSQLAKLTATDAGANAYFGYSVAISGNTAILGATGDDELGYRAGAAYVFDVSDPNDPVQLFKLTAAGAFRLGFSVDISGNIAIVGAYGNDSAYLFDITTGSQLAKLTPVSEDIRGQHFGCSVGISGDNAIVGAWLADGAAQNSGMAFLFDATVPEPSSLAVLVIAGSILVRRRRPARGQNTSAPPREPACRPYGSVPQQGG